MCLVSPARFLAPSYRLLPSSTHLCEQLLSREQVQRHGEAPIATSNMVPLPTMEIFDTAPSLVSRGCSGWSDLGHQRLCLQLALEAGNGDGAAETKELVDRRRGHGCGRALTVRDARCGRLSETGAHSSRCERAGLFWWWPTSVPGCGQQRGELGVGRRCRAREQRKVRGRVNLRAWVADASRNGASNLVSVSGGLGAGSRSANPRLRGSARVLALLGAGRGRGALLDRENIVCWAAAVWQRVRHVIDRGCGDRVSLVAKKLQSWHQQLRRLQLAALFHWATDFSVVARDGPFDVCRVREATARANGTSAQASRGSAAGGQRTRLAGRSAVFRRF